MGHRNAVDTSEEETQKLINNKPRRNNYALAISILASMTSILLGYDTGVMSGATLYIKRDLKISDVEIEILVGTINVFSLIGSALAGRTSDWIGRRYTMVLAAVIFFVGAILMGLAPNYSCLMGGRFVAGVGMGFALMISPVYAAEVAPASTRGFLTSFTEVFVNFGVLFGYVSNYAFARLPLQLGWRLMLGVGAVPSVILAVVVLAMPESPRWLVMQGRLGDACRVLERTSDSPEEAQLRLADIKEAAGLPENCSGDVVPVPKRSGGQGVWKELFFTSGTIRHIMIAAIGIQLLQQASGIDAVVMYSPRIYEKAGIKNDHEQLLATIGVGVSKTLFVLVATFLVDRLGRRVLLLTSCGGLAVCMFGLAVGLTVIDRHPGENVGWAVVLCVGASFACVAFFSIGMGPVAWVYSSEIFPLKLRAQGCSLGVSANRFTSGVILMTFISLYKAITIGGAFFLFTGITVLTWIFFFTLLPETRGRTLEEMEALFGTYFKWRSTMKELDRKKAEANY